MKYADTLDTYNDIQQQRIPDSKKTEKWWQSCVDSFISQSSFNGSNFNSKDTINKNLVRGIIDVDDFKYVTNPHGLDDKSMPAEIFNINIIAKNKKVIIGEEIKRPFEYTVISTNPENSSIFLEKEKELLNLFIENKIMQMAQRDGLVENYDNPFKDSPELANIETPKQVIDYSRRHIKTSNEIVASQFLELLKRDTRMEFTFREGFSDYIDTNKEIYAIEVVHNTPMLRKVNSEFFDCGRSTGSIFVDDANWTTELMLLSKAEIIDIFYDKLTTGEYKELDRLESVQMSGTPFARAGTEVGPFGSGMESIATPNGNTAGRTNRMGRKDRINMTEEIGTKVPLITVFKVCWKGQKEIWIKHFIDEYGIEQEEIVPKGYVAREKAIYDDDKKLVFGEEIKKVWPNKLCMGYRIGDSIYKDCDYVKSFYSSIDNISKCKVPYVGIWRDEPSFVEESKHYQYLYYVILFRLQMLIASDRGKALLMDITQIPAKAGWNVKRWLYYLDAMKIAFVDPYSEGMIKRNGKRSDFNQFQSVDLSAGNQIEKYVMLLDKIDDLLGEMIGVTPQRRGSTTTTETLGGIERSILQSSYITEYLYSDHEQVKHRAITALLDASKGAYANGKRLTGFSDEGARILVNLEGNSFSYSEHDIWVSSNAKDFRKIERLRQMAGEALSAGKMIFKDAMEVVRRDNLASIVDVITSAEEKTNANAMKADREKNLMQMQMQNKMVQQKDRELQILENNNIRDNQTRMMISNSSPDVDVKGRKLDLDTYKATEDIRIKDEKNAISKLGLLMDQDQHEDDIVIKEKQLAKKPTTT